MDRKELNVRREEQERLGHPAFKNEIVQILVHDYEVERNAAQEVVYNSKITDCIMDDMVWSQHMGPNYWAKTIIEQGLI